MPILFTGTYLNAEIENLFYEAKNEIFIISPFIKLHERIKDSLELKKGEKNLKLIVVFGKNNENFSKSINKSDIVFFTEFLDVEIRYQKRLHAKIYANDSTSILTSMNLYDFSMNNNIEFGVLSEKTSTIGKMTNLFSIDDPLDEQVTSLMFEIIDGSQLIFKKEAFFEGKLLTKKYVESKIVEDKLDQYFSNEFIEDFKPGFCIRTGRPIPFNPKKPLSKEAFMEWKKFNNDSYKENYCHYSGENSNGETSFKNPIMNKNLLKAQNV